MQNQNNPDPGHAAEATCNLDCFATGRCTCHPNPKGEAA